LLSHGRSRDGGEDETVAIRYGSRLFDAKVLPLTSGFTGSAAEHVVLAMRHSWRGTLLGRATFGANPFGGDQDPGGCVTSFIPVGRTFDPTTGEDWETVGVAPDAQLAPAAALSEALARSGVWLEAAITMSAEVAPGGPVASPRRV
jgi:C-terminal processing protease CtpA/Prc